MGLFYSYRARQAVYNAFSCLGLFAGRIGLYFTRTVYFAKRRCKTTRENQISPYKISMEIRSHKQTLATETQQKVRYHSREC